MRADGDIKADVIVELQEVHAPGLEDNILDALMVEDVQVSNGLARVTLVLSDNFEDDQREAVESQVHDVTADIAGLIAVELQTLTPAELRAADPLAWVPGQPTAAPAAGTEEGQIQSLTLGQLMANVTAAPASVPAPSSVNLYAGGGCAAGTTAQPAADDTPVSADGTVTLSAAEFANLVAERRVLEERLRSVSERLRSIADEFDRRG